ncbi:hypothetical protein NMY22_g2994 [Coprinellus aureogranulatus]|nr:hypothetical protein NMY22_g2994 [Coprinellus aureogranulatus]
MSREWDEDSLNDENSLLTQPEELNPEWTFAIDLAYEASTVGYMLFTSEGEMLDDNLTMSEGVLGLLPDLIHAVRTLKKALENKGAFHQSHPMTRLIVFSFRAIFLSRIRWRLDTKAERTERAAGRRAQDSIPTHLPPWERVHVPFVVVDSEKMVGFWNLPGALSQRLQGIACDAVQSLAHSHSGIIHAPRGFSQRSNPQLFSHGEKYTKGTANFAHCWFPLGHESDEDLPAPSATCTNAGPTSLQFIKAIAPVLCVTSAILSIMHPLQWSKGFQVHRALANETDVRHRKDMLNAMQHWTSPFHAFQLIINRETLTHRDTGGFLMGMDVLSTFGEYECGYMDIPAWGIKAYYPPGTMTAIMGHVFEHGVPAVGGESDDSPPEYSFEEWQFLVLYLSSRFRRALSTAGPCNLASLHTELMWTCTILGLARIQFPDVRPPKALRHLLVYYSCSAAAVPDIAQIEVRGDPILSSYESPWWSGSPPLNSWASIRRAFEVDWVQLPHPNFTAPEGNTARDQVRRARFNRIFQAYHATRRMLSRLADLARTNAAEMAELAIELESLAPGVVELRTPDDAWLEGQLEGHEWYLSTQSSQ